MLCLPVAKANGARIAPRPVTWGVEGSAATAPAAPAIDRTTGQCTARCAENRPRRPTIIETAADQRAGDTADNQAGRTVAPAAIGAPVPAPPFAILVMSAGFRLFGRNRHRRWDNECRGAKRQHQISHDYVPYPRSIPDP